MTISFLNHYTFEPNKFNWKDFSGNSILFLDIDGVINTPTTYFNMEICDSEFPLNFEKDLVSRLQEVIDTFPNLFICISSSNRYGFSNDYLEKLLLSYGLRKFKFLGATSILDFRFDNLLCKRGLEVQQILDYYKPKHYVIIDDMIDFLESQQSHFVHINGSIGLQEKDIKKITDLLKIECV